MLRAVDLGKRTHLARDRQCCDNRGIQQIRIESYTDMNEPAIRVLVVDDHTLFRRGLTALLMYSLCLVSPVITQPRQITASKAWWPIKIFAPEGNSNDPGTQMISKSCSFTWFCRSVSRHPFNKAWVIGAFH